MKSPQSNFVSVKKSLPSTLKVISVPLGLVTLILLTSISREISPVAEEYIDLCSSSVSERAPSVIMSMVIPGQ